MVEVLRYLQGHGIISNEDGQWRLLKEVSAIDRGIPLEEVKPGNNIQQALTKLVYPPKQKASAKPADTKSERKLALVRG